jgi:hypothetical protein
VEASTIVLVFGFLMLGTLAYLNSRELVKDLQAVRSPPERRFVREELRRARLRAAGWFLLFAGAMVRLFTGDVMGDIIGTIVIGTSVASFLADGILGRLERRRILRGY